MTCAREHIKGRCFFEDIRIAQICDVSGERRRITRHINDPLRRQFQDSIEQRLRSFNQDLWVPPLEVLQARAEAEEQARAEAEGELAEGEEGAELVEGEAADKDNDEGKSVTRTTKRGSKSSTKTDKKSAKAKAKEKKTKIKERKPKSSNQTVNTGVRSVRNRKK